MAVEAFREMRDGFFILRESVEVYQTSERNLDYVTKTMVAYKEKKSINNRMF